MSVQSWAHAELRQGNGRYHWKTDDIRIDLKEIELDGVDWIDLAQNKRKWWAIVKMLMNLHVR